MQTLFTPENWWVWGLLLAFALFFPVRRLLFVLAARRSAAKYGPPDEVALRRLSRRVSVTSALLCYVFAMVYANHMFGP